MQEPVFRITPKKYGGETTIISVSIDKDMLAQIDDVANLTGRNRNEILQMSLEFVQKSSPGKPGLLKGYLRL